MKKVAFFNKSASRLGEIYGKGRRDRIAAIADIYPEVITSCEDLLAREKDLQDVEAIFSTWGMLPLKEEDIQCMPSLKAVFYAAGSVKGFAEPFLKSGVDVVSAWRANGIPVAETTLALILLSNKGYFRNIVDCSTYEGRHSGKVFRGPGNYGETVALIGAGAIGRKVIEFLRNFELKIIVYDPYLTEDDAKSLGVEKVSLEDAFARGVVVSNHVPLMPSTVGMLKREHFALMREGSTFINTGRGATIEENGLIETLKTKPSITALLDVTHPEPPVADSEFYKLPNVFLSSHIAGSFGDEISRMVDYCIDEFERWLRGDEFRHAVSLEMLEYMA